MKYQKLSADCNKDLLNLIKRACESDKRTIANFIRLACSEKARRILEVKNATTWKSKGSRAKTNARSSLSEGFA